MTLPEIREKTIRLMSGGISTDENPYDDSYIDSIIDNARAYVLRQDFIKFRRWQPISIQQFYPEYQDYYQDSVCYTRFTIPTGFIQGNSAGDGLVYFGSSTKEILKTNNFWVIQNRNTLSDFLNNSYMSPASGRYIGVLFEGLVVTIISKDSMIKYPLMSAVFERPSALPDYNIQKDNYPIDDSLLPVLYDTITNGTLKIIMSRPPDIVSDSRQTPVK